MPSRLNNDIIELCVMPRERPFKLTGVVNEHATYIIPEGTSRATSVIVVRDINTLLYTTAYRRTLVIPLQGEIYLNTHTTGSSS